MKTFPYLAALVCLCTSAAAQEYSFKFGKIAPDELTMTSYAPEPDAEAVFIYDDTDIHYVFGKSIQVECYRSVKIKVLKDEGVRWGDVTIDRYHRQLSKETVSRLSAAAYNLVDGKTVKTQLAKQNIFEEAIDENTTRLKFSIPDVKAGTVIEYRYTFISDFIGTIPDVGIQHSIPSYAARRQVSIPEYFTHHIRTKGYLSLPVEKTFDNGVVAGNYSSGYTVTKYTCTVDRVPSLRREPYIWYLDDFRAGLEFEINGLSIPGSIYKNFTKTWNDVYESLKRSEFGRYANIRNPFKDEVTRHRGTKRRRTPTAARHPQTRPVAHHMGRNLPAHPTKLASHGRRQRPRRQRIDQFHPRRSPARRRVPSRNHPAQSPFRGTAAADPRHGSHPHLRAAHRARRRRDGLSRRHRPAFGCQRAAHATARRPCAPLQCRKQRRRLD